MSPIFHIDLSKVTGNNRYYPADVIDNAIREYLKKIENGTSYGGLGTGTIDIDLTFASHKIVSLHSHNGIINGELTFLDTPNGKIAKQLFSEMQVVPFGVGNVERNYEGKYQVSNDYKIISFDLILKKDSAI